MVSFTKFMRGRGRVSEAAGDVMADASEAIAYRGTAGKMWRWILRPFADLVLKHVPFGGRVLDLGTGPGLMPIHWARKRPDIEVVGVDLSPAMLSLARAEAGRVGVASRVRFIQADATNTGLPTGSFDVVACHYMLHHFDNPASVLREMQRLVRVGGAVLARDLARPSPWLARLSTMFTSVFLRNSRLQNHQYAESLAASFTAGELRSAIQREELMGFEVRGGPVHITAIRRPDSAHRNIPVTHERLGRLLAGTTILAAVALAHFVSPWFLLAAAGTATNLVLSGITDRCAIKNLLIRLGLPGERDVGHAEVLMSTSTMPRPNRTVRPMSARRRQEARVN